MPPNHLPPPANRPPRRRRLVLAVFAVLLAVYVGGAGFAVSRRYPVEIRETSRAGTVAFTPQTGWKAKKISSAVWWRGGLFVRHAVYSKGLVFAFTTSGRVFGLMGTENDGPYQCEESFWWTGDPHHFPFPARWYGDP